MKRVMLFMMILMILSLVFTIWGVKMHADVVKEEAAFHDLQSRYWNLEKSIRDTAATDSTLNKQLVEIENYPSDLLRLKLVGIGKILTGIYLLLFGILMALIMMPRRLAAVIKGKRR